MRRYTNATSYSFGKALGASPSPARIRDAIESGAVSFNSRVLQEGERLDTIAGQEYGDSSLWWVIASASGIGWAMQVPPGTRIVVPNLDQVGRVV
jgi:hypothetical protein